MSEKICMLCDKITEQEFKEMDLSGYYANLKMDGERNLICIDNGNVNIINRRGREKSEIYKEISESAKKLDITAIFDAEIIAIDGEFNSLQHRSNTTNPIGIREGMKKYPVKAVIFDILSLDNKKVINLPLIERKKILEKLKEKINCKELEIIDFYEGEEIMELWEKVKREDSEGIILKLKNSRYEFRRSNAWLKLKNFKEKICEFDKYEVNNAGLKLISQEVEVQVQDDRSGRIEKIKEKIDNGDKVKIEVQYLTINPKTKKMRFPSTRKVLI